MSGLDASKVQELMHRLQSLDVDLQEAARSQIITEADYAARLKRLRRAMGEARKLKEAASAQTMPTPVPSHFDLPVMSGYSRIEQRIVARFVTDTKNYTNELATKLQRVSGWTLDAVHDGVGWFKVVWRLSWIRRELRRVEHDIDRVRKARGVVEDFISKSEIGGLEPNPKTNQRDLLAAFTEFEASTGRVTALRAKLRSEMARNEEMRQWLSHYANSRKQVNPEKMPPEPHDVALVGSLVADQLLGGAKVANERLVVARRLATSLDPASGKDKQQTTHLAEFGSSDGVTEEPKIKSHYYGKKKNRHQRRGAGI